MLSSPFKIDQGEKRRKVMLNGQQPMLNNQQHLLFLCSKLVSVIESKEICSIDLPKYRQLETLLHKEVRTFNFNDKITAGYYKNCSALWCIAFAVTQGLSTDLLRLIFMNVTVTELQLNWSKPQGKFAGMTVLDLLTVIAQKYYSVDPVFLVLSKFSPQNLLIKQETFNALLELNSILPDFQQSTYLSALKKFTPFNSQPLPLLTQFPKLQKSMPIKLDNAFDDAQLIAALPYRSFNRHKLSSSQ